MGPGHILFAHCFLDHRRAHAEDRCILRGGSPVESGAGCESCSGPLPHSVTGAACCCRDAKNRPSRSPTGSRHPAPGASGRSSAQRAVAAARTHTPESGPSSRVQIRTCGDKCPNATKPGRSRSSHRSGGCGRSHRCSVTRRLGMTGIFLSALASPARRVSAPRSAVATYLERELGFGRLVDYGVIVPRLQQLYEWSAHGVGSAGTARRLRRYRVSWAPGRGGLARRSRGPAWRAPSTRSRVGPGRRTCRP